MNNGINFNDSVSVDSHGDPFAGFYGEDENDGAVEQEDSVGRAMRGRGAEANVANAAPQANGHNKPARVDQAGQGGFREAQRNDRGLGGLGNGLRPLSARSGGADAQPLVRFRREKVSEDILAQLRHDAVDFSTDQKAIQDVVDLTHATYATRASLEAGGSFSGETLINRIIAKAYGVSLLEYIDTYAEKSKLDIKAYTLGRIDGTEQLESSNVGSQLQANVLCLNGKPFLLIDAGNNSQIRCVANNRRFYRVGYYNEGSADRDNLAMVRVSTDGRTLGSEAFVTTNHVLPTSDEYLGDINGPVIRIKSKDVQLTGNEKDTLIDFFDALVRQRENDPLFNECLRRIDEYGVICDIEGLGESTPELLKEIAKLHDQTTSSISN